MLGLQRKSTTDLYFPCFEISKGLFLFSPRTHFAKLTMHLENTFYSENIPVFSVSVTDIPY